MNDLRILRDRQAAAENALDRQAAAGDQFGSAAMCAITTTVTTYPTSATAFYVCNPELLSGAETEGAAATFTTDTATVVYASISAPRFRRRRRRLSFTQPAAAGPSDTTGSSEF